MPPWGPARCPARRPGSAPAGWGAVAGPLGASDDHARRRRRSRGSSRTGAAAVRSTGRRGSRPSTADGRASGRSDWRWPGCGRRWRCAPSCSSVVPNSSMWRWAISAKIWPGDEQAVREEELVVGPTAADASRSARRAEAVARPDRPLSERNTRTVVGLAAEIGADRLTDHGARRDTAGSAVAPVVRSCEPEPVGEVVVGHEVHVAADDPVDVGGNHPGVGDRGQRRLDRQRQRRCAPSPSRTRSRRSPRSRSGRGARARSSRGHDNR